LAEAEECLLAYGAALTALEKGRSLKAEDDRRILKRLARLREYQTKWDAFPLTPGQLASLGLFLSEVLAVSRCDHTHRHTTRWLVLRKIGEAARVLESFEDRLLRLRGTS
jgi:hypothetical protein